MPLSSEQERSIIPAEGKFLIEYLESNEGYHILMLIHLRQKHYMKAWVRYYRQNGFQ